MEAYDAARTCSAGSAEARDRHRLRLQARSRRHFDRQKKLSAAGGTSAIGLLTKASEELRTLNPSTLRPGELAALFRAAAAVASAASDAETIALGVDDVLKEWANSIGGGK